MRCKNKKGQYFAFDAITGVIIFVLTIVLLFSYWYNIKSVITAYDDTMYSEAVRISDMLMSTGQPMNWSEVAFPIALNVRNDVGSIGLLDKDGSGVVDFNKIDFMTTCANVGTPNSDCYNATREVFRTGYDYYVVINYTDGGAFGQKEFGNDLFIGNENVTAVSFTRLVPIDTSGGSDPNIHSGQMKLVLWAE